MSEAAEPWLADLRTVLDHVPSMVAYWDGELICRFANRAYEKWFGVQPDDLIGTRLQDLLGPTLYELNRPHIEGALAGEEQTFERYVPHREHGGRYSLARYVPHRVDGEVQGFIVDVTDITPLHAAQASLRAEMAAHQHALARLKQSEASLREAQRLGGLGSWEWEVDADLVTWSDTLYRIFGRDPKRLPPSFAEHPALYTPASWRLLEAAVREALHSGRAYELELEYVSTHGTHGWLEARGEAVRGADGRVIALRGTALEISSRRALTAMGQERDRLALAKQAHASRAQLVTEAAAMGLWRWVPSSDHFVGENARLHDLLGLPDAASIPLRAADAAASLEPAGQAAFLAACDDVRAGASGFELVARVRGRADASGPWVEFHGRRVQEGVGARGVVIGTVVDVSQRVEAEALQRALADESRATADSHLRFRAFFDQGSYFAAVLALDGTVLDANRLCLDACGYRHQDVVGTPFADCGWWNRSSELMAMVREAILAAQAGDRVRRETPYFLADGRQRMAELLLTPVRDELGQVHFIAATGEDISERLALDAEVRKLAKRLAASDRRKTEFMATLAHELLNPLGTLHNINSVLRRAQPRTVLIEQVQPPLERQVIHMTRLVRDLLDVGRIESGKLELHTSTIELHDLLMRAAEMLRAKIDASHLTFSLLQPSLPVSLTVDVTRMTQVIANLLDNAVKFTPKGGHVQLAARHDACCVEIAVSDDGVGIAAERLHSIFDMFTQLRHGELRPSGLGIGLALVRNLVELHGGEVRAESEGVGRGTTMTVTLPIRLASRA